MDLFLSTASRNHICLQSPKFSSTLCLACFEQPQLNIPTEHIIDLQTCDCLGRFHNILQMPYLGSPTISTSLGKHSSQHQPCQKDLREKVSLSFSCPYSPSSFDRQKENKWLGSKEEKESVYKPQNNLYQPHISDTCGDLLRFWLKQHLKLQGKICKD